MTRKRRMDYNELVAGCYEMALHPETLPAFMLSLRNALEASNVTFGQYKYVDGVADVSVFCTLSFSDDWRNDVMARDYNDPENNIGFKLLVTSDPGKVVCSEDLIDFRDLKRLGFYNDICKPLGIGVTTAITLTRESLRGSGLFYQFGPDRLPDKNGDIALANALAPHLRRSAQIMEDFGSSQAAAVSFETLMTTQSFGVVLLDDQSEVIFMNEVAQGYARSKDAFGVSKGKLFACSKAHNGQFRRAIDSTVKTSSGLGTEAGVEMLLPRQSGRRPMTCVLTPIMSRALLVPIRRPAAMLVLKDPESFAETSVEKLGRAYGLSRRQATICTLLANGVEMEQICEQLSITRNTLRTHVRRLYEKLDCRSQAELIRMVSHWS